MKRILSCCLILILLAGCARPPASLRTSQPAPPRERAAADSHRVAAFLIEPLGLEGDLRPREDAEAGETFLASVPGGRPPGRAGRGAGLRKRRGTGRHRRRGPLPAADVQRRSAGAFPRQRGPREGDAVSCHRPGGSRRGRAVPALGGGVSRAGFAALLAVPRLKAGTPPAFTGGANVFIR